MIIRVKSATVAFHVSTLLRITGERSRAGLVGWWFERGVAAATGWSRRTLSDAGSTVTGEAHGE